MEQEQKYVRIVKNLNSVGKLIPVDENPYNYVTDQDQDYYVGIYEYNLEQFEHSEKIIEKDGRPRRQGIAGITDVVTKKLVFDIDSGNLETAQKDAVKMLDKLIEKGIGLDYINISFSGSKGFFLEVNHKTELTPDQHKTIALGLAQEAGVKIDPVVYNASRYFRLDFTKHPESGLFKTPLSESWLRNKDIEFIKKQASIKVKPPTNPGRRTQLPTSILLMKPKEKEVKEVLPFEISEDGKLDISDIDLSKRPQWLSPAKFLLRNGVFTSGNRNTAFMVMGSTYKNQGYSKIENYHLLKAMAEIQSKRTGQIKFEAKEIYKNIIEVIYSDTWKGGQYSYEKTPLLQETTKIYGLTEKEETDENPVKLFSEIAPKFKSFVCNIDSNTIKTGIKTIDDNVFLSTGTNVHLLGAASSGKSSILLEILRNTSANDICSVFFSLDMASTRIFEKILYTETGMKRDELYKLFKNNQEDELLKIINKKYKNVYFYDKSQPTVDEMRSYILKVEEETGKKVKLVCIDYFERIYSEEENETANSKRVAGKLQDLVNDMSICLITLVQPNKASGDASVPIYSYCNTKGSAFLYQSARVIMSIHREGFSPRSIDDDKFLTLNVLKNDLGEIGSYDLGWQGKRGTVHELNQIETESLQKLRSKLQSDKEDKKDSW